MSALATKLLQLPRPADKVADLLWRLADPSALTVARTPVSDAVWDEQLMLALPGRLAQLARLMDRPERVDIVTAAADVRAAVIDNPRTGSDLLAALAADRDPQIAGKATERLDTHTRFLAAPSDDTLAGQVVTARWASAIVELYRTDPAAAVSLLARFDHDELPVRGIVLDLLDGYGANTDAVRSALVGVLDPAGEAHIVDDELAQWLISSDSVQAEASRAVVADSLATKKAEIASRLVLRATAEAAGVLATSAMYVDRPHPRQTVPKLPPHAKFLDEAMLDAMSASGLPAQAIAALVFNSIGELPDEAIERVFDTTVNDSPAQALAFLLGQLTRRPTRESATRLLELLSDGQAAQLADTYTKAAAEMHGKLPDVPWRLELLRSLPGLFKGDVADEDLAGMNRRFCQELGNDDSAWEFAVTLAGEWNQSLDALLSAARLA